jgi:DNA gyrase inhibitor GyrI
MKRRNIVLASALVLAACIWAGGRLLALEEPAHKELEKDGKFALREYEAIPVVSAPMDGMGERNDSFRKLFRYISGDNEAEQTIEMTSPVIMSDDPADKPDGTEGTMSFMIPAAVAKEGAPAPDGEDLSVSSISRGKFAVLRFKKWRSEDARKKAIEELLAWVEEKKLEPLGEPVFAFYDPPWTPELLRRNEVWLRVK